MVAALASHPAEIPAYPNLDRTLEDPLAKAVLDVLQRHADTGSLTNPLQIMEGLRRTGISAFTEIDVQGMFDLLNYGEVNLGVTYKQLLDLWAIRKGVPLFSRHMHLVEVGQEGLLEAIGEMASEAHGYDVGIDRPVISSADWGGASADLSAQERRDAVRQGRVITFPPEYDVLSAHVRRLRHGIISYLSDTGRGKTSLADKFAHHLAQVHGRKVLFFPTEASADDMRFRYVIRHDHTIRLEDLEDGLWDDRCRRITTPYPSGGEVIYIDGGGLEFDIILALAERYRADLFIDLWHDVLISKWRKMQGNESMAQGAALAAFEAYCQRHNRLGFITLQPDKVGRVANRAGNGLRTENAIGSSFYENKSRLALVGSGFKTAEGDTNIPHPFAPPNINNEPTRILIPSGGIIPIGQIKANKNTWGPTGFAQYVYLDPHFDLRAIPASKYEIYRDYL